MHVVQIQYLYVADKGEAVSINADPFHPTVYSTSFKHDESVGITLNPVVPGEGLYRLEIG